MTPPTRALAPSFSTPDFRAALGTFATGVTIVTARDSSGQSVGLTALKAFPKRLMAIIDETVTTP